MVTRLPDWEDRLAAYLAERHAASRFGYAHAIDAAQDDCCTFAAGAVLAITGVDAMAEFRGRYRTRIGSLRALRRIGAGSLADTLDGKFGRIRPAFAQRGDLVMTGSGLAVCMGAEALQAGDEGLQRVPREEWVTAWATSHG